VVGDTVRTLFGDARPRFDAHEPGYPLHTRHRCPRLGGWLEVGIDDQDPRWAVQTLVSLADRADLATRLVVVPDQSHTFSLWSQALADSLPWIVGRIDLQRARPARSPAPAPSRPSTPPAARPAAR
jgi:hypothetical protein